jgi:hypothetical protein
MDLGEIEEGRILERMIWSGGGVGLYSGSLVLLVVVVVVGRKNVECGTWREMMVPKKEILAIHLVERRGSSVSCADGQYLLTKRAKRVK